MIVSILLACYLGLSLLTIQPTNLMTMASPTNPANC